MGALLFLWRDAKCLVDKAFYIFLATRAVTGSYFFLCIVYGTFFFRITCFCCIAYNMVYIVSYPRMSHYVQSMCMSMSFLHVYARVRVF
jgi:hypothetical protein